ncbi:MAG: M14 family zinc carboxypeptidase [Bacteroidales bacterium]
MNQPKKIDYKLFSIFAFLLLLVFSCSETIETPTEQKNFSKPATSEEVIDFCKAISADNDLISFKIIGHSAQGKDLIALRAALSESNTDTLLKVMLFAQQHGNEQSGKEALLFLLSRLPKNADWLENTELWIVPQLNPEGADNNKRRNSLDIDLNRDHVVKKAPETKAIHDLFNEVMPHVTVDIHEYNPYSESWEEFCGYKNFDVQVGIPTNINVNKQIISFAENKVLPEIEKHLNKKGFSFHNYLVGPAPGLGRTRHSTVDINDGRQSFAILNTLSFIYEGKNGRDSYADNLKERTYSQYEAIYALIDFLNINSVLVKQIVEEARGELYFGVNKDKVAIRMEHVSDGSDLVLPLTSSKTGNDTVAVVEEFHPQVIAKLEVNRPEAYLVPVNDSLLKNLLDSHEIIYFPYNNLKGQEVTAYKIKEILISEDENLENRFPEVEALSVNKLDEKYIYVPTAQLHSNFLVLLLEPQSMLGIAQREGFEYLLKENEVFPVFRVE